MATAIDAHPAAGAVRHRARLPLGAIASRPAVCAHARTSEADAVARAERRAGALLWSDANRLRLRVRHDATVRRDRHRPVACLALVPDSAVAMAAEAQAVARAARRARTSHRAIHAIPAGGTNATAPVADTMPTAVVQVCALGLTEIDPAPAAAVSTTVPRGTFTRSINADAGACIRTRQRSGAILPAIAKHARAREAVTQAVARTIGRALREADLHGAILARVA